MTDRKTANVLKQYREKARMQQEELEKALEKHNYRYTRGYISLCETGRSMPSLDFLRGCELVYGLPWGELIRLWAHHIAKSKGERHHITAWQFHKLLGEELHRRQETAHPPTVEEGPPGTGEGPVEE